MPDPILEVKNLVVQRGTRVVLRVPHLDVREGETLAVIGPNGAGKSTLLLALAQLLRPGEGEIRFRGEPLTWRDAGSFRRKIALVLQEPLLLAAIRRGDRGEARRIINHVLVHIYSAGEERSDLLKGLLLELVVMISRAAVEAGAVQ